MTGRERLSRLTSRRSILAWIGIGSGIAFGTGTGVARDGRPRNFGATASDDPNVPGHEFIGSDGRGVAQYQLRGGELQFTVRLANLNADALQIHIHGEGRADGSYLVRLYEPEDEDVNAVITGPPLDKQASGVTGAITDGDVAGASGDIDTVAELVEELDAEQGVLNVHTEEPGGDGGGEIAGLVEARGQ
jgi:hypothetical protein